MANAAQRTILVTGAAGQIGSELVPALRTRFGPDRVIASDVRTRPPAAGASDTRFEHIDCTDAPAVAEMIARHNVGTIYHLAAILSAVAEEKPQLAWELNVGSLYVMLEAARRAHCAVFFPSSVGAFGPSTPRQRTPQDTLQRPTTMYGVTKVAGELLGDYYAARFGVDVRGIRFPGLISYSAPPGGGTTDYAVDIFHHAVRHHRYACFLRPDTRLDMVYMPDAIAGILQLMQADARRLVHRNAFNVTAMNFTPAELAEAIRAHIPDFAVDYEVDPVRQAIADSWPRSLDDAAARTEWGWAPTWTLERMTRDMLDKLRTRAKANA